MGTEVANGRVDQTILRYCDSESAEEISLRLGGVVSPERVAARKEVLLTTKNWVTAAQQEELILYRLRVLLAKIEERFQADDLDSAMVQLRLLKEIGNRFDKRREATQLDLEKLYGNQAAMMLRAFDIATSYLRGAFREQIDQETWDEAILEGMRRAEAELEKHRAIEE
ncbi:hypothetical protein [Microbacterium sp.]|uniref:hypothetical protein n=1 Tax=Microbacterium sp. TaxID=51671 RepID=UPI0039E6F52E